MPDELQKGKLEINDDLINVRVILQEMIKALKAAAAKSREHSLVITKLEEAEMWALKAQIGLESRKPEGNLKEISNGQADRTR